MGDCEMQTSEVNKVKVVGADVILKYSGLLSLYKQFWIDLVIGHIIFAEMFTWLELLSLSTQFLECALEVIWCITSMLDPMYCLCLHGVLE